MGTREFQLVNPNELVGSTVLALVTFMYMHSTHEYARLWFMNRSNPICQFGVAMLYGVLQHLETSSAILIIICHFSC